MPRPAPYGYSRQVVVLHIPFSTFLSATTARERILSKTLGFRAKLEKVELIATVVATGTSASRVVNVRKGSATGTICGTITALLADGATVGAVKVGTVTTTAAANEFGDADTLTVEFPTGGTVFTAGTFDLVLTFRAQLQREA